MSAIFLNNSTWRDRSQLLLPWPRISSSDLLTANLCRTSTYRRALGLLQYLSFTRPDVSFAVNKLSQFLHSPREPHWDAVKRVFRYLKGTLDIGFFLHRHVAPDLTIFSYADWGGSLDDGRSTTGYAVYFGRNLISWKSSKQRCVSRSSTEAEYRAIANASAEAIWVRNLLSEVGISVRCPATLLCDNLGATYVCKNPIFHSRMKHLALDYFFVRELVQKGFLSVSHISSGDQIADVFTKPLSTSAFQRLRSKLGLPNGSSILRGRIKAH